MNVSFVYLCHRAVRQNPHQCSWRAADELLRAAYAMPAGAPLVPGAQGGRPSRPPIGPGLDGADLLRSVQLRTDGSEKSRLLDSGGAVSYVCPKYEKADRQSVWPGGALSRVLLSTNRPEEHLRCPAGRWFLTQLYLFIYYWV
jgi:hypothetical protein